MSKIASPIRFRCAPTSIISWDSEMQNACLKPRKCQGKNICPSTNACYGCTQKALPSVGVNDEVASKVRKECGGPEIALRPAGPCIRFSISVPPPFHDFPSRRRFFSSGLPDFPFPGELELESRSLLCLPFPFPLDSWSLLSLTSGDAPASEFNHVLKLNGVSA